MGSLKSEGGLFPNTPVTLRMLCTLQGQASMRSALWHKRLARIQNLFDGGTSEEDEDKAINVLNRAGGGAALSWLITKLGWDALDDDLDEGDLTKLAGRLRALRDRDEYEVDRLLWFVAGDPEQLAGESSDKVFARITTRIGWLGSFGAADFADRLLDGRKGILNAVSRNALRGLSTRTEFLVPAINGLADVVTNRAADLRGLAWDVQYDNQVSRNLEAGNIAAITRLMPGMVNPDFPDRRRVAIRDAIVRREQESMAVRDWITIAGTPGQRADAQTFFETRQLFIDNFPAQAPDPGIIEDIAQFFGQVTQEFDELVALVDNFADELANLTLDQLTGETADDMARQIVNDLGSQNRLALLPFRSKSGLVSAMLDGFSDDDDEQAILSVFTHTKQRLAAEAAQLLAAATWEALDFSFDGQEYDDLEALISSW